MNPICACIPGYLWATFPELGQGCEDLLPMAKLQKSLANNGSSHLKSKQASKLCQFNK